MWYKIFNTKAEADAFNKAEADARGCSPETTGWFASKSHPSDGRVALIAESQVDATWIDALGADWEGVNQDLIDSLKPIAEAYHDQLRETGAPITYSGEIFDRRMNSLGTVSNQTYHFQMRKFSEDTINWTRMDMKALFAQVLGQDLSQPFPSALTTTEDVRIPATIGDIITYASAIETYVVQLYEALQQVKGAIEAGEITQKEAVEPAFDTALQAILNA